MISDLYDFYMHGDLESLDKANGVRRSDVWFLLNGMLTYLHFDAQSMLIILVLRRFLTGIGHDHRQPRQIPQAVRFRREHG